MREIKKNDAPDVEAKISLEELKNSIDKYYNDIESSWNEWKEGNLDPYLQNLP